MPGKIFTESERERLCNCSKEISQDDLIAYFTMSPADWNLMKEHRGNFNRMGVALQIGLMRFFGFCPEDFEQIPTVILEYIAHQIRAPVSLNFARQYGKRKQTRTSHLRKIQKYLGFQKLNPQLSKELSNWLLERALEHDKPSLLFQMVCEKLYSEKILRPGVTTLERMIIKARQQAQEEVYRKIEFLLTHEEKAFLDQILEPDEQTGRTPFFWLRFGSTANNPTAILDTIEKLDFLKKHNVDKWDISSINPNRQKFLAQLGRKFTNQALQRAHPKRRYPILMTFLKQTLEVVVDELIDQFDRCLGECNSRAKGDLKRFQLSVAKTTNEKIILLKTIGKIVLNPDVSDCELRSIIYREIPEKDFRLAVEECDNLIRPESDQAQDFMGNRYSYIREFAPKFLEILHFKSNKQGDPLMEALKMIQDLNTNKKRKIPPEAPLDFVPDSWISYVEKEDGQIVRRYYEISTLWKLRESLRSGDIWVECSRRYANPESYLIPKEEWESKRSDFCQVLGLPQKGEVRIQQRQKELETAFSELDQELSKKNSRVRIEKEKLVLTSLEAEELPESCTRLKQLILKKMPRIEIADLLIEVDRWTHFSDHFKYPGSSQPPPQNLLVYLYASLVAQACNFGFTTMAEISDLSYSQLAWCSNWHLTEETIQLGLNALVNYQYRLPLSKYWGGGTMSSSDGQRFPIPVKAKNASIVAPYSGYGRILTHYTWSSDQFSQWGCKPIPSIIRDSTYVLDGILDNETELQILEHTTDTAGFTERVFALFDCLGLIFSPRIRDLCDQVIYRIEKNIEYPDLNPFIKGTINVKLILDYWDDILRVVASLKLGWVTASLFISKLQAQKRQSNLSKALQEYGRLIKSIYIPTYLCREDQQRRVSRQLNKGEALHALRRWLLFANEGQLWKSQLLDQGTQASALTLVPKQAYFNMPVLFQMLEKF